jgi:hypothetical protein
VSRPKTGREYVTPEARLPNHFIEQGLSLFSIRNLFANTSSKLHNSCLDLFHGETLSTWAGTLVCGESLDASALRGSLVALNLYHFFVVSGSHLVLIDQVLRFLKCPKAISKALMLFYTFVTDLQAPLVRALFFRWLAESSNSKAMQKSLRLQLQSLLLCVIFCPAWWDSLSLHLSFVAALCFSKFNPQKSAVALAPLLAPLGIPSLAGWCLGQILVLFLELVILPLCLLSLFSVGLAQKINAWLGHLEFLFALVQKNIGEPQVLGLLFTKNQLWFYSLALWFLLYYFEVRRQRAWLFDR